MFSAVISETGPGRAQDLGPVDRIPVGEGRRFLVGSQTIAVFRLRDGQVFATQANCPHRTGPLEDGAVGGTTLVCPLHVYRFNLTTGAPLDEGCGRLQTYPAHVTSGGRITVAIGAG